MKTDQDIIGRWGIRWRVAHGYGWIFDAPGLRELLGGETGQTLRSSSTRKVVRGKITVRGKALSLVIKIYRPPQLPLSLFRSRGRREYEALREAERRGIETVRAVAVGETRKCGALTANFLLTEELPDCTPLSDLSLQSIALPRRRRIIRSVAAALRVFHDKGIMHRDLHAGNILLSLPQGGEVTGPAVFIIDLHGAVFRSSLNLEERMRNLIQLNTYYGLVSSRSDRWFFLGSYDNGLGCDSKEVAGAVEKGTIRARWRLWQRRRRRYLRARKYSHALRCGRYRGYISARRDTGNLRKILRDPAGAYGRGRVIKSSRTNRVASLRTEEGEHIVIKWHRPPSLMKRVGTFMRSSRGRKAWCGARGLTERMIRSPDALAFVDSRRFGFITESFFIADFLERASLLPHYARDRRPGMTVRERREFCKEMGKFLADIHRRGVYHSDLKGSNIMVREGAEGGYRLYLLDPEAVRFVMRVTPEMAVRNLSRLDRYMRSYASATDRLATLVSYLAALGTPGLLRDFREAVGKKTRDDEPTHVQ